MLLKIRYEPTNLTVYIPFQVSRGCGWGFFLT
jgi:hypothetical protein